MRKTRPDGLSWKQAGVMTFGVILLILGLGCFSLSIADLRLLAFQSHYIDAELEVVKYELTEVETGLSKSTSYRNTRGHMRKSSNRIEGIIHPGEIPVVTNDRDIQVSSLDSSNSVVVTQPLRKDVEGQRFDVLFWAADPNSHRWYHPPRVLTATRPTVMGTSLSVLFCVLLLSGALVCFRYGYDRRIGAIQNLNEGRPSPWPPWTLFCVMGAVITWPLLMLITLARTTGHKVSPNGRERMAFSDSDWALSAFMILVFSIVPVMTVIGFVVAVRHRLRYGRTRQ